MTWKFRDPTLIDPDRGREEAVAVASLVRWGHTPKWLKKRLAPYEQFFRPSHLLDKPNPLHLMTADWHDHCGTTVNGDGEEEYVSEPYQLTARGMRSLLHFAETLDLDVIVQAPSAWYPTHTLRITLKPNVSNPNRAEAV